MKKHIHVNGKFLNQNKTIKDLRMKQREWIANLLREKTLIVMKEKNRTLNKLEKETVLKEVYSEIEKREIWIPYNEIKNYYNFKISKYQNGFYLDLK